MAIQSKILTRQVTADIKDSSGAVVQTVSAGVGTLALGKPGDIMTRAYGPVIRALVNDTGADKEFGTYVAGKGILVNPNDCAAVGTKFDTVKVLKKGQIGSFLVSGACVVKCSEVETIAGSMKVQDIVGYSKADDTVCEIEVNGFDVETPVPSSDN